MIYLFTTQVCVLQLAKLAVVIEISEISVFARLRKIRAVLQIFIPCYLRLNNNASAYMLSVLRFGRKYELRYLIIISGDMIRGYD